ncbi:lycopene beta-cyclase [Mesonia algae]|uniref:Lycopene beta-cyclase n=1 Tax=Mesonia algae TaxID=213248 RepID=A0A2W7I0E0_9FLAO|nr:lycopene cyclase family protein [Mesonia algae]PZW39788.1 lycopene beta-cyclase [Mesonia algae]
MQNHHYDFIIVGSGLAGLQLALAFSKDNFFKDKSIALIDESSKSKNDKTWCYWEKGKGKWDHLIHATWNKGAFISNHKNLALKLSPYTYKMLRSIDFYNDAKSQLKAHNSIKFIQDCVTSVEENETEVQVIGEQQIYTATHVFDSRIPEDFFKENKKTIKIHQHFKGWMIETSTPQFNPKQFIMMDYRLKWKNSTSFTYVLPISPTKAFVEYTFFTPFTTEEDVYDEQLKSYIKKYLNLKDYRITETEMGNIPMTNFPFHKYHSNKITKIGTGGGWVKPSTGYSFKHTEKKVKRILQNFKEKKSPSNEIFNKKFYYYDKVFLKVIEKENEKGEWLFEQFYSKNSIQDIFKYLDEETNFSEDLRIMGTLYSSAFIKAFFKSLN